jgi:WD40 repeat protein
VHEFQDDRRKIWSVSFSPDGTTLASAGEDGKVTLRDLAGGRIIRVLHPQGNRVRSIAFSPDGLRLATATWEGAASVQIWDLRTGEAAAGPGASVAYSRPPPACRRSSGPGFLYDAHSFKVLYTFTGHGENVWQIAFSPDGKTLASTSWDRTLRLWSVSSAQLLLTFQLNGAGFASAFSADGRTLAATASFGTRFWDAADPVHAEED